jgi:hypothetical protein
MILREKIAANAEHVSVSLRNKRPTAAVMSQDCQLQGHSKIQDRPASF